MLKRMNLVYTITQKNLNVAFMQFSLFLFSPLSHTHMHNYLLFKNLEFIVTYYFNVTFTYYVILTLFAVNT